MKKLLHPLLLALAALSPWSAAQAGELPWVEAELRRVDLAAHKLTLKHGEIPNLEMPPMTMVFQLKDDAAPPELLAGLKPGDRLRFRAALVDGRLLLVELRR